MSEQRTENMILIHEKKYTVSLLVQRLESEKESLERDLSFKADQARQYDCLLEAVRENNRQLQVKYTCLFVCV